MQHNRKINLLDLARNTASEIPSMVRELEGADREDPAANLRWPARFISAGAKGAPPRWRMRFVAAGPKSAPTRD